MAFSTVVALCRHRPSGGDPVTLEPSHLPESASEADTSMSKAKRKQKIALVCARGCARALTAKPLISNVHIIEGLRLFAVPIFDTGPCAANGSVRCLLPRSLMCTLL